jgi:hypothetical protein
MKRLSTVIAFSFLFFTYSEVCATIRTRLPASGQIRTLGQSDPIDSTCPIQEEASDASQAQNRAKNNFCRANVPVEVNISTLRQLEAATQFALTEAHIPFGSPTSSKNPRDTL